jgi:hypothetical protein
MIPDTNIERQRQLKMFTFNSNMARKANKEFAHALHQLSIAEDASLKARVCVCCDCFLDCFEHNVISVKKLRKAKSLLPREGVFEELKEYYTVPNCPLLKDLVLSPRACYIESANGDQSGYLTCDSCISSLEGGKLPVFAIANYKTIGEAPLCLSRLNPVEIALIGKARTDKHVFQYFGGAHMSMKGWHTMYETDLNQLSGVLNELEGAGVGKRIATVLVGAFTSAQMRKTLMESVVRIEFVREALQWLADFNCNYDDVDVSTQLINSVIMIDHSEDVQEVDSKVESVYEFTGKTLDATDVLRMEQLIFLC